MFFQISNAVKKRFTLIFQEIFLEHPIFNKTVVVTKFPTEERPKFCLLIRSVSGNAQKLSLDNFMRTEKSFCSLANLKEVAGNSIEWVRDDVDNLDKMSAPGFYIVKITKFDQPNNTGEFVVNPYLLVDDEELDIQIIGGQEGAVVKNPPINDNSDVIFTDDGLEFKRGIDYTIDYTTGTILFNQPVKDQFPRIMIDYQIVDDQRGPFEIEEYMINNTAIPGILLAFGDRLKQDDEQVVVVEKRKRDTAKVYGGRWTLSIDLIGIAQDPDQQERLVDYAISRFWADWQDRLVDEGINIYDFSLSGEAEDLESELPEEYYFTGNISFTAEVEWQLAIPLISEVRRVDATLGVENFMKTLTNAKEDEFQEKQFDERMVNSKHRLGLQIVQSKVPIVIQPDPILVRTLRYPR